MKNLADNWRPSNLSELTSIIFDMQLIHLGSKASILLHYRIIYSEAVVKGLING